mgnify:CR=1 FL=1
MFNIPITITSQKEIMDVFEIFTKFPHETIMIKNGDVAIDGHSIMGFFSLDINKPVELVLSSEPTESFTNALSKYMVAARINKIYTFLNPMTFAIGFLFYQEFLSTVWNFFKLPVFSLRLSSSASTSSRGMFC